jgi:hypothetical protein
MASARAVLSPSCAPSIAGRQRKRHADRTLVCGTRSAAPRPTRPGQGPGRAGPGRDRAGPGRRAPPRQVCPAHAKDCERGGGGCWRVVDDFTTMPSHGGSDSESRRSQRFRVTAVPRMLSGSGSTDRARTRFHASLVGGALRRAEPLLRAGENGKG